MTAELKDYYELLGISRLASGDEIRKAFRQLARRYHPDLAPDKVVAEEKFKEINSAYEVLSDPEKRRKYDRGEGRWKRFAGFGSRHVRRQNPKSRGATWSSNFRPYTERPEFRSFYDEFKNGRRPQADGFSSWDENNCSDGRDRFRRPGQSAQRGQDIEGEIMVSLEEVLQGSIHTISVLRHSPLTGDAEPSFLRVRIPAGVQNGQTLRLDGKGEYGIAGGASGDLQLGIKVAAHPIFRVRGNDLFCDLELTPWEALFGSKRTIPTLEGTVSLKIPPRTRNAQQLRVRGKGLPDSQGVLGHLYAVISIKIPFQKMVRKVFRRG